jgi:hypothetical protein
MPNARDYVSLVNHPAAGNHHYFVAKDNVQSTSEAQAVKRKYVKLGHKVIISSYRVNAYPYKRYRVYATHQKVNKPGGGLFGSGL